MLRVFIYRPGPWQCQFFSTNFIQTDLLSSIALRIEKRFTCLGRSNSFVKIIKCWRIFSQVQKTDFDWLKWSVVGLPTVLLSSQAATDLLKTPTHWIESSRSRPPLFFFALESLFVCFCPYAICLCQLYLSLLFVGRSRLFGWYLDPNVHKSKRLLSLLCRSRSVGEQTHTWDNVTPSHLPTSLPHVKHHFSLRFRDWRGGKKIAQRTDNGRKAVRSVKSETHKRSHARTNANFKHSFLLYFYLFSPLSYF